MTLQSMMKYLTLIVFSTFIIACSSNKNKEETSAVNSGPSTEQVADASGIGGMDQIKEETAPVTSKISFSDLTKTLYFGFDKSLLTNKSRQDLNRAAIFLKSNPSAKLRLEGHTDERGSREYNMALGERRGQAVKDYLVAKGIAPARLEVISYGEEKPAVRASTPEAYAKNRRVVIKLR